MMARSRRRIWLRVTAFPTFRLITYATSTEGLSSVPATKLIRSGPLLPLEVGLAKDANCRRVRTRPGTLT